MGLGLPLGPASQGSAPGPPQNGTEPEACAPARVSLEGSAESVAQTCPADPGEGARRLLGTASPGLGDRTQT